jgi:hypothetical protein
MSSSGLLAKQRFQYIGIRAYTRRIGVTCGSQAPAKKWQCPWFSNLAQANGGQQGDFLIRIIQRLQQRFPGMTNPRSHLGQLPGRLLAEFRVSVR